VGRVHDHRRHAVVVGGLVDRGHAAHRDPEHRDRGRRLRPIEPVEDCLEVEHLATPRVVLSPELCPWFRKSKRTRL
jgi:hypothetical protein